MLLYLKYCKLLLIFMSNSEIIQNLNELADITVMPVEPLQMQVGVDLTLLVLHLAKIGVVKID